MSLVASPGSRSRRLFFGFVAVASLTGSFTGMSGAQASTSTAERSAAQAVPPPGGLVPSTGGFGFTDGNFSVAGDGAAVYQLPLWLPAGRGDVRPALGLSFQGRGRERPAGRRVVPRRALEHHAVWSHIRLGRAVGRRALDASDAFCLNGVRLLALSSASAPTREYRTEEDMFARVVADGMSDGIPDSFPRLHEGRTHPHPWWQSRRATAGTKAGADHRPRTPARAGTDRDGGLAAQPSRGSQWQQRHGRLPDDCRRGVQRVERRRRADSGSVTDRTDASSSPTRLVRIWSTASPVECTRGSRNA